MTDKQHSVEELTKDLSQTALKYFLDKFKERNIPVEEGEARACLGNFGLGGKLASDTPIGALSGGQKVSKCSLKPTAGSPRFVLASLQATKPAVSHITTVIKTQRP